MLHILGFGHAHPETRITNRFLEELDVGVSDEWIMERIGIRTRRSVLPLDYIRETRNADPRQALEVASHSPTELGVAAARMALERAGVESSELGLIVANTGTPAQTVPSEAQRIGRLLDVGARAFDITTACPAFALHLDLLDSMRESTLPPFILCVCTAAFTTVVDYRDGVTAAIWGDGAAAWVVSPTERGGLRVVASTYHTDPRRSDTITIPRHGYFRQDGRAVRRFSVRQTVELVRELVRAHDLAWDSTRFVGHQANAIMLDSICRTCAIPETSHWSNVREIGNQAAASAPAVISMRWDDLRPGDRIAAALVGAGLSWGSALLEAV